MGWLWFVITNTISWSNPPCRDYGVLFTEFMTQKAFFFLYWAENVCVCGGALDEKVIQIFVEMTILLERTPLSAAWHLSTVLARSQNIGCLVLYISHSRQPMVRSCPAEMGGEVEGGGAPKVELGQDMVIVAPH